MQLEFISRENYSAKNESDFFQNLKKKYGEFYMVPEGGNNELGVKGCTEILKPEWRYDYILTACGTATTFAGLLISADSSTIIVGINVLKGNNSVVTEVQNWTEKFKRKSEVRGNEELQNDVIRYSCITDLFAFKGYARYDQELVDFKHGFESSFDIPLDYIYTNKLFYAGQKLLEQHKIPAGSRVLFVHSGGLQGNAGFESRYNVKPAAKGL